LSFKDILLWVTRYDDLGGYGKFVKKQKVIEKYFL